MFSLKKTLMFSTVYLCRQGSKENIMSIARIHNPPLLMLPDRYLGLGFNSNLLKGNSTVALNLAHKAFAVPFVSEDTVPIIILHGLLGSKNNWNSLAKSIMKNTGNRMVITLDARNHGDSPHSDQFNYDVMVSDLVKFLRDKSIDKASFIGHSMGGRTLMLFATKYPTMVQSMVVVDISPVSMSASMSKLPSLFQMIKGLEIDPYLSVTEARKTASTQLKEKHKLDDSLVSFLMTNLVASEGLSNWRWKFNLNSILKNFQSGISSFPELTGPCTQPTLFVGGRESDYLQESDEPKIKTIFPTSTFVYISGAGHWVHAEKPQEFLAVVTNFLSSIKT